MMKMNINEKIERNQIILALSQLIEDEEDVDNYQDDDDEYYEECIFNL